MERRRCLQLRHRIVEAIALIAVFLIPESLWPWERIGHRVAARMAEVRLNPAALEAVRDLLGNRDPASCEKGILLADDSDSDKSRHEARR